MKIIKSVEVDTDDLAQLAIDAADRLVGGEAGLNDVELIAKKRFDTDGHWDGFIIYTKGSEPTSNKPA